LRDVYHTREASNSRGDNSRDVRNIGNNLNIKDINHSMMMAAAETLASAGTPVT
jgi:hypothetical protein